MYFYTANAIYADTPAKVGYLCKIHDTDVITRIFQAF